MTRRAFLQAIPGVLPLCHPSELPPLMSLTWAEFERLDKMIVAEMARLAPPVLLPIAPDIDVTLNKARWILRAAVRELGPTPMNYHKK